MKSKRKVYKRDELSTNRIGNRAYSAFKRDYQKELKENPDNIPLKDLVIIPEQE